MATYKVWFKSTSEKLNAQYPKLLTNNINKGELSSKTSKYANVPCWIKKSQTVDDFWLTKKAIS